MRAKRKRKDDPHLATTPAAASEQAANASTKITMAAKRPKRSKDQRLNLKRSYEAFLEAVKIAGDAASSVPSPSETWPMRPYAASI